MTHKWKPKRIILTGLAAFLLASLLTLQFIPQQHIFRVMQHYNLLVPSAHGTDITQLTGLTGNIGKEDIEWGSGLDTDTFTVPSHTSGTVTLTKLPSIYANIASLIKGRWYVSTDTIANQADNTVNGSLAWIVTQLAGSTATIELPPDTYTFAGNYTFPATVALDSQFGAIIQSNGHTITINGPWLCGKWKSFTAASGEIVLATVNTLYPEWWGAVADGDGVTDDGPELLAAVTAAPAGATVQLSKGSGYYNAATELAMTAANKPLTVRGPGMVYYGGAGKCFSITCGVGPHSANSRLIDLDILVSSGNEGNGTGVYIDSSNFVLLKDVYIKDFDVGVELTADSSAESNRFERVLIDVWNKGYYIHPHAGATDYDSFRSTQWEECFISMNDAYGVGLLPIGIDIARYASIYQSRASINMHLKEEGAIGFKIDGAAEGFHGVMGFEGGGKTGNCAFYIDQHAQYDNWNIHFQSPGVWKPISYHASQTAAVFGLHHTGAANANNYQVLRDGVLSYSRRLTAWDNAGDVDTEIMIESVTTAGALKWYVNRGTFPYYVGLDDGLIAPVGVIPIGGSVTITDPADTTPSVKGMSSIWFNNGSGAVSITNFDDGANLQYLFVVSSNPLTKLVDTGTGDTLIVLDGRKDQYIGNGFILLFKFGTKWWQVGKTPHTGFSYGTWASISAAPNIGEQYICTNCTDCGGGSSYPIWWNGTNWVCATGVVENGP